MKLMDAIRAERDAIENPPVNCAVCRVVKSLPTLSERQELAEATAGTISIGALERAFRDSKTTDPLRPTILVGRRSLTTHRAEEHQPV